MEQYKISFHIELPFPSEGLFHTTRVRPLSRREPAKYHINAENTNRKDQIGVVG